MSSPSAPNHTLVNGLRVLERLASVTEGCSVSALAAELGLPKSHAHRLLRTLLDAGYVAQSADTHEYRSDYRLLALAGPFAEGMLLRVQGGPVLRALSEATHGGAYLAVVHRGEPLIVMSDLYRGQSSPHALGLGQRLSRHASAFGKLFLALNRLAYRDDELTRFTAATITSRHALDEELVEIRRRDYSINRRENGPVHSFAAPIRAATGELLGAIGIALDPSLVVRRGEASCIEVLLRASGQLESRLAGTV